MLDSVKLFRTIALPLWAVLLMVYLVIFWFQELRSAALMRSQGASKRLIVGHAFLHGFVPAIPAALLTLLCGNLLMRWITSLLLRRGFEGLVDVETIAQTLIITQGEGVHGIFGYTLLLFGILALALAAVAAMMAGQNIMKLLRHKE